MAADPEVQMLGHDHLGRAVAALFVATALLGDGHGLVGGVLELAVPVHAREQRSVRVVRVAKDQALEQGDAVVLAALPLLGARLAAIVLEHLALAVLLLDDLEGREHVGEDALDGVTGQSPRSLRQSQRDQGAGLFGCGVCTHGALLCRERVMARWPGFSTFHQDGGPSLRWVAQCQGRRLAAIFTIVNVFWLKLVAVNTFSKTGKFSCQFRLTIAWNLARFRRCQQLTEETTMKIVDAVCALFPSGNGQDEGTLSAAADALRGLPELTDEQADAVKDAVWPYDDFREDPDEWMEGKEADAAYPFWKQLTEGGEGTGDEDIEEEEDDSDDESEDVDPGDDEPPADAMEGMDADAIAALAAAATPGASRRPTHNLSDLFDDTDDDPDDERKKRKKNRRGDEEDEDDEFRELKLAERKAKLAHTELTLEERRRKLHGEEKPKEQLRVPRCVVPVLADPSYLEIAAKVLKHAERARDDDPLKVIKARGKLAKIRTKSEAFRWETADSSERAVHEQVLAMLDAVAAGDDVTRPNWFKGNFITGHWIAD